jgi:hypothetical protein
LGFWYLYQLYSIVAGVALAHLFIHVRRDGKPLIRDVFEAWRTSHHKLSRHCFVFECPSRFFRFRLSFGHDFKPDPLDDRNGGVLKHHAIIVDGVTVFRRVPGENSRVELKKN